VLCCLFTASLCLGQTTGVVVSGSVKILNDPKNAIANSDAVIWLTPLFDSVQAQPLPKVRLLQKDKRFTPHLLVITVGTQIESPNQDPFFHNVFSIYRGKPFDLGLYESGSTRTIKFTQPGISYIFCNIHPEMSAVVVALKTNYFAITGKDGNFKITNVQPGKYRLEVWHEQATEKQLKELSMELEVKSTEMKLKEIQIQPTAQPKDHLNKYGEPYDDKKPQKY
jgi:hypothetical protein